MLRDRISPLSDMIRAILLEDIPCCGVPHRIESRPMSAKNGHSWKKRKAQALSSVFATEAVEHAKALSSPRRQWNTQRQCLRRHGGSGGNTQGTRGNLYLEEVQQHAEVVLLPKPRRPAEHPHRRRPDHNTGRVEVGLGEGRAQAACKEDHSTRGTVTVSARKLIRRTNERQWSWAGRGASSPSPSAGPSAVAVYLYTAPSVSFSVSLPKQSPGSILISSVSSSAPLEGAQSEVIRAI